MKHFVSPLVFSRKTWLSFLFVFFLILICYSAAATDTNPEVGYYVEIIGDCANCGICVSDCPEVFAMGDFGAEVINQPLIGELIYVKFAQQDCPVGIIYTSW